MATVVYSMMVSADGYIEDPDGDFGFSVPDDDVHRHANEQAAATSAWLFGRKLYEVMEQPWTDAADRADTPEVEAEFADAYVAAPRYVFSDTLTDVPAGVTLVRRADAAAEVRRLQAELDGELGLGGAGLAASLADLIDEYRPYVLPVTVGGGTPFFPRGVGQRLRLLEQRTFPSGVVHLRYARAR